MAVEIGPSHAALYCGAVAERSMGIANQVWNKTEVSQAQRALEELWDTAVDLNRGLSTGSAALYDLLPTDEEGGPLAAGLLARIPGRARHSIDVDLYFAGEFDAGLGALREAAEVDLGDYFTFDIDRRPPLAGVAAGGQRSVTPYLGDKEFERFKIDVVVTAGFSSGGGPRFPDPPAVPVHVPSVG